MTAYYGIKFVVDKLTQQLAFLCHSLFTQCSGSQNVLSASQGIRDQFPGDPWIRFCNSYSEVYLFITLNE